MLTNRPSNKLQNILRKELTSGVLAIGDLLPSVRQLSATYNIAPRTVHKVLQYLEKEGLIFAEPRKGYRVKHNVNDPRKGCPVAFLLESSNYTKTAPLHFTLRVAMENILSTQSGSLLSVFSENKTLEEIMTYLKSGRAWGVLLDTVNRDILNCIKESGMPAVMIDAWVEDAPFDVVLQDNYQGGFQAGHYLAQKGFQDIAWVGPIGASAISRERFGGASSALATMKQFLTPENCFECNPTHAEETVRKLLSSPKRPKAILSLWSEISVAIAKISKELSIEIGADFEMVGWSTEDRYEEYKKNFNNHKAPPTIVWDPERMAQTAINRLWERWAHPHIPPMRLLVDTTLRCSLIQQEQKV